MQLNQGVKLRFQFTLGAGLTEVPRDLPVTTSVDAFNTDKDRVPNLYLPMKLSKPDWHCSVVPARYERFFVRSESDDYTITPMIFADDAAFQSQLNVTDSQPHEVNFLVRKNTKVRGKLNGYLEGLGPQATALGWTENLHPTIKPQTERTNWLPINYPDIQRDGSFELSLPPGKAKVSFGGLAAAIVEPAEYEFVIELARKLSCQISRSGSSKISLAR